MRISLMLSVAVVAGASPWRTATACSSLPPDKRQTTTIVPLNGQTNVPRKTLITSTDRFVRVERTGEVIELDVAGDTFGVFVPRRPLPAK